MEKIYLGMATSQHDPAIAIVNQQGEVVFAEALERSTKNKRAWHMVPDQIGVIESIVEKYLINKDITLATSWSEKGLRWSPLILWLSRMKLWWSQKQSSQSLEIHQIRQAMYKAPSSLADMFLNLALRIQEKTPQSQLKKIGIEHHLAHAYTAAYTSRLQDALCVIVDGMGEGSSTAIFSLQQGQLSRLSARPFLNLASLGLFYSSICYACGFDPIKGEEWKVMGLAPYGKKDDRLYAKMKQMLWVEKNTLQRSSRFHSLLDDFYALRHSFSTPREAADLAHTAQVFFEEIMCALLQQIHAQFPHENLILGGGCALNSSCNGKILQQTPFRSLHVPMCPGDDGNALGAALRAWHIDHPQQSVPRCHSPYLGSEISEERNGSLQTYSSFPCQTYSEAELYDVVASLLSKGNIVAWVQGRAEFGPRALGNRSILADPRSENIKDTLNERVKFREEFRPFAPSILAEHAEEYFLHSQYSPYMERTLTFSKFDAPGVVHHNNTGRLQTVTAELNPRYYALIHAFYTRTGVPILLNTSFNVMGRPIVHDIEDAIGVFCTSGIDVLVVNNTVYYKKMS